MRRVVIVGAGVAGLSCARALADRGFGPIVVERARGVGGRCATRRVEGQPVDHGVAFLHGSAPELLAAFERVPASRIDWPRRVEGQGTPCQPRAFARGEIRLAFAEGVSAFPKHLARGLDVRLETRVTSLTPQGDAVTVGLEPGGAIVADDVVLALPADQARALVTTAGTAALEAARAVLGMVANVACLTVIARYDDDVPLPEWDILHPESSRVLVLVSVDSRKRGPGARPTLVLQAHPRWSRERIDVPDEQWGAAILEEAARLLGPWAARPSLVQRHRWRYARVGPECEFPAPLLLSLPGKTRLGIAGEAFAAGGGTQAAFLSGRELARRISGETEGTA